MKKLIVALLLLWPAVPARALTLAEIRTEVRVRIKDTATDRRRFSDAQLTALINEAQRDVNNAAWVVGVSTSVQLVSGTTFYALPEAAIAILRVTRDYRLLKEVTLDKLDADFMGGAWFMTGGIPTSYYQDLTNIDQIGLYPWPNGTTSTGTLRIDLVSQPADLSDDTDEPFNADERYKPYDDLLIFYPAYRVFLIEGDERATLYRQEYESRLQVMRDRVGRKPNFNPSFTGGVK